MLIQLNLTAIQGNVWCVQGFFFLNAYFTTIKGNSHFMSAYKAETTRNLKHTSKVHLC